MSKAHAILIMICIILVSIVWNYHLSKEGQQLDSYNACMNYRLSTDSSNCIFCDSISKL
mgnify:FL=1